MWDPQSKQEPYVRGEGRCGVCARVCVSLVTLLGAGTAAALSACSPAPAPRVFRSLPVGVQLRTAGEVGLSA